MKATATRRKRCERCGPAVKAIHAVWFNVSDVPGFPGFERPYSAFPWDEWAGGVMARKTAELFFPVTEYRDPDGLDYGE